MAVMGWFGAYIGGMCVEIDDLIVADRNGVVVVPFDQIDAVIKQVSHIIMLEDALEEKVKAGFSKMEVIEDMIKDGRAVVVD